MRVFGRVDVMARVDAALAAGDAFVLVGPGGIGKSAIADECASAFTKGFVRGGGVSLLATEPWFALDRAVGVLPRSGGPEAVAARVVAALDGRCLVIEDLQWVDPASRDVLAELTGRVPLLVTSRDGDAAAAFGWEAEEVPALGDLDAAAVVRAADPKLSDAQVAEVVAFAAGHPLSIVTAAREGVESLGDVVVARLAALSTEGRVAAVRAAMATTDADAAELGDLDGELDPLGLLRPHSLVADAVLDASAHDVVADAHRWWAAREVGSRQARHLAAAGDTDSAMAVALAGAEAAETDEEAAECLVIASSLSDDYRLRIRTIAALIPARRFDECVGYCRGVEFPDDVVAAHADVEQVLFGLEAAGDVLGMKQLVERIPTDGLLQAEDATARRLGVRLLCTATNIAVHTDSDRVAALALAESAWEAARRNQCEVGEAGRLLGFLLGEMRRPGWRAVLEEALDAAENEERFSVRNVMAAVAYINDDLELTLTNAERLGDEAERGGYPTWQVVAAFFHGLVALREARLTDAVAAIRAVDDLAAPMLLRAQVYTVAGVAAAHAGDDLRAEFDALLDGCPQENPMVSEFLTAQAWMEALVGDLDAAASLADEARATAASEPEIVSAEEIVTWVGFERDGTAPAPPTSPVDRLASLRYAFATAGDADALRDVLADAERLGVRAISDRCRTALRKLRAPGFGGGARDEASVDGLTAREREVLELVRDGMTDAAIAARLDLSRSTVSATIRRAAVKLGVTGRAKAAAKLAP